MSESIDLNADLGEGCAFDSELMAIVSSCNIACGGHAGDDDSMYTALRLAKQHGVAAGAHPSFPDRENFGRRKSDLAGKALEQVLREQVTRLKAIADDLCIPLTHLKPHGALYNMAACDEGLSANVINVLQSVLPDARLVGPPASQTQILADRLGIPFVAEGFADRAYEADGQLRDRQKPGAVLSSGDLQAQQALDLATRQRVTTYAGDQITLLVDSICVHGDTPGAFASACQIKASFLDYGLSICAPA